MNPPTLARCSQYGPFNSLRMKPNNLTNLGSSRKPQAMVENITSTMAEQLPSQPASLRRHLRLRYLSDEWPSIPSSMANIHVQSNRAETRLYQRPPKHRRNTLPPYPSLVRRTIRSQTYRVGGVFLHGPRRGVTGRRPECRRIHLFPSSDRRWRGLVPVCRHPCHRDSLPIPSIPRHRHVYVYVLFGIFLVCLGCIWDEEYSQ